MCDRPQVYVLDITEAGCTFQILGLGLHCLKSLSLFYLLFILDLFVLGDDALIS